MLSPFPKVQHEPQCLVFPTMTRLFDTSHVVWSTGFVQLVPVHDCARSTPARQPGGAEQSEADTVRMGRLVGRDKGLWSEEQWAPQLQWMTKQPPSLMVSS